MSQIIDTPCIGICSTVYGDEICRGCKRQYEEVINWNQYSVEQKHIIYTRLNVLAENVLPKYLEITDKDLIEHYSTVYKIRRRPEQGIHSLLFSLLYWEFAKIDLAVNHGFLIKSAYAAMPLEKLVQLMDSEILNEAQL